MVIREAVSRAGVDPAAVEEVIMGQVVQGGSGQAPARQALIHAGLPASIPALTINKVCGSGLKAVMLASQAIKAGDAECIVAGGQESMSSAPHYVYGMRSGIKAGNQTMVDGMIHDGLWDSFGCCHMGEYAEYTAEKAGVTPAGSGRVRLRQPPQGGRGDRGGQVQGGDPAGAGTRARAGRPRSPPTKRPRKDTSAETLAKLKPAFRKDGGTVTAGNAPGLNDGASALVVTSLAFAKAHGLTPLARVTAYATGGGEPRDLFFAPVLAVRSLMEKAGTTIGDYDLIEANEAFAVQALADGRELGWDWDRVNVQRRRGGAGPPDRRERRPGADDAALRAAGPGRRDRPRDPLPRRRQRGGPQRGADLMAVGNVAACARPIADGGFSGASRIGDRSRRLWSWRLRRRWRSRCRSARCR